jgi:hypothetical protein
MAIQTQLEREEGRQERSTKVRSLRREPGEASKQAKGREGKERKGKGREGMSW